MRKKLTLTLAFLCLLLNLFSQTNTLVVDDTNAISLQRWKDTSFGLIDKSAGQIPSGYLIDYSLAQLNDSNYNSQIATVDTLKNGGLYFSIYSILTSSVVNGTNRFSNADSFYVSAARYQRDNNKIPLLFLFQQFQKIRKTALSENLFSVSADSVRLMDVPGRTVSPYDTKSIFVFSPFKTTVASFNAISFVLPASFWLMPGITSVQIDFSDGKGPQTLTANSSIDVYYPASGIYLVQAAISTISGSYTAKSQIAYTRPATYNQSDTVWNFSVSPALRTMSTNAGNGNTSNLDIIGPNPCGDGSIYDEVNCDINPGAYGKVFIGCDHVFDKPIIIVEGFDPEGKIDADNLFNSFNSYRFVSDMRSQGYDFVFVIFTKNGDKIENNAKVLEAVINKVNATKSGSNGSTIIGYSMGGLITRWCLKEMEDRGIDHKVANYFSYDAPHQGANVPLGLQVYFNELAHDMPYLLYDEQFSKVYGAYKSYAAQEMLVTAATYNSNDFNLAPNLYTLSAVRSAFAQNLINKGYPQNVARYGIAFGRGNNTISTKNAGNGVQFGNFGPGSNLLQSSLNFNNLVSFAGNCFAVPENSQGSICQYHYAGLKVIKIFGFSFFGGYVLRARNFKYTGQYAYDDAPGGYANTQTQFVSALIGSAATITRYFHSGFLLPFATTNSHYAHAFVPTASALDLQNQNFNSANLFQSSNLYYNIDNDIVNPGQVAGNTLSTAGLSPFQSVLTYTSDCASVACQVSDVDANGSPTTQTNNWNQSHLGGMSAQTTNFLERKILNAVPNFACNYFTDFCNNTLNITGNSQLCPDGTTYQYGLTSDYGLAGVNIVWSFPNGLFALVNGQGTPVINVRGTGSGNGIVSVVVTNTCGQTVTRTFSVSVGTPAPSFSINGIAPYSNGPMDVQIFTSAPVPYKWYVDNSLVYTAYSALATINGGSCGTHTLRAEVTNGCGTNSSSTLYTRTCSGHSFILAPNPASTSVTIQSVKAETTQTLTSLSGTSQVDGSTARSSGVSSGNAGSTNIPLIVSNAPSIVSVNLLTSLGNVVRIWKFVPGSRQVQLNVSGFASGTYFLEISDGTNVDRQKIIISNK